jgi:hypothetical protein
MVVAISLAEPTGLAGQREVLTAFKQAEVEKLEGL